MSGVEPGRPDIEMKSTEPITKQWDVKSGKGTDVIGRRESLVVREPCQRKRGKVEIRSQLVYLKK